jgi:hypothetical protein
MKKSASFVTNMELLHWTMTTETTLKQQTGNYLLGTSLGLAIAGFFVPMGIGVYVTYGLWTVTFIVGMLLALEKI